MQPYRITTRTIPHVCKAARPARTMFTTPFFPHFGPASSDFAPLFRLLDSAAAELSPTSQRGQAARRTFTPRFDVREAGAAYELQGELPGIEQRDLEIEFVDERTLVIRGKTATESTRTNEDESTKAVEAGEAATADTASEKSAKFQKASVEDEYVDAGAESATEGTKTPNTITEDAAPTTEVAETKKPAEPSFKYWVSERTVGEFERRFSFPGRVDQEAVKASLRNGILSVVVPKLVAKEARKIEIQ